MLLILFGRILSRNSCLLLRFYFCDGIKPKIIGQAVWLFDQWPKLTPFAQNSFSTTDFQNRCYHELTLRLMLKRHVPYFHGQELK